MTIHIQLEPEVETSLLTNAHSRGMTLDAYVRAIVEDAAAKRQPPPMSDEEFEAGLDELAEGSESLPVLPPEAYTRESIYGNG
ncbi:MAG: hypothetical protein ABFC96_07785 [Thermoguttaceae bacterium]